MGEAVWRQRVYENSVLSAQFCCELKTSKKQSIFLSQPIEWEKVFANHVPDKMLVFRIHKELLQLNNKK